MARNRHYRYQPKDGDAGLIDREAWITQALAATASLRGRRGRRPAADKKDKK